MIRKLFKLILIGVLILIIGWTAKTYFDSGRKLSLPPINPQFITDLGSNLLGSVNNFVPGNKSSPLVMGVNITNQSLETIGDMLKSLNPDQLDQLRMYICTSSSPSADNKVK